VFESKVLRRIFGPKRVKVIGGWRKLHNEKLYNVYTSTRSYKVDQIKGKEMGRGASSMSGEMRCIQNCI
jgi:hypothetical protein